MPETSTITDTRALITGTRAIGTDVSVISMECPAVAASARPGNFVNIKVADTTQPLLRRPFCVHNVHGDTVDVMVKAVGRGSALFRAATTGSTVMVLGPLGNAFGIDTGTFDSALLVSGGIGTAPMRFLETRLDTMAIPSVNLVGGRTSTDLLTSGLANCRTATDDGSAGFRGNVVDLLKHHLETTPDAGRRKVFACGPNPMLKAVARFCAASGLDCELSLESVMGCGIGICYGCMVELNDADGNPETILLCKEGPVIDGRRFLSR